MRIAIVGRGRTHDVEHAIARGARRLGHDARVVDADRLRKLAGVALHRPVVRALVEHYAPDAVVFTSRASGLGEDVVRRLAAGRLAAFWYFDADTARPSVQHLARWVGTTYVTCIDHVDTLRAAGAPDVRFLPQAADLDRDRPAARVPARYRCDVSFVGSGRSSYRWPLLSAIAGVAELQIRGPEWADAPRDLPVVGGLVTGDRFAQVVGGAGISLGANGRAAQARMQLCVSNRMWKVLGCGGFFLGPGAPGLGVLLRDREHCVFYRDEAEAVELVRHYLAHPAERARIAAAGHAHVLERHGYEHRLALLLAGRSYEPGA